MNLQKFTVGERTQCSKAFKSFMTEAALQISGLVSIFSANQWTGFYMITASFMTELIDLNRIWMRNI